MSKAVDLLCDLLDGGPARGLAVMVGLVIALAIVLVMAGFLFMFFLTFFDGCVEVMGAL